MENLRDREAVITGGASGIGLATAEALAREGTRCVLADIERETLDAAAERVTKLGADAIGVVTDVSKREDIDYLVLSGHKLYAPGSRGALVGSLSTLSGKRCVTDVGGGMVEVTAMSLNRSCNSTTSRSAFFLPMPVTGLRAAMSRP